MHVHALMIKLVYHRVQSKATTLVKQNQQFHRSLVQSHISEYL